MSSDFNTCSDMAEAAIDTNVNQTSDDTTNVSPGDEPVHENGDDDPPAPRDEDPTSAPDDNSPPPEIIWSDRKYGLGDLTEESGLLQRMCRFSEAPGTGNMSPGLKIYSEQPVWLHSRHNKRHAKARTIYKDTNGAYFEVGQTLLIPDDFQGWFELVPPDFTRARYCRNIAEVASVMPKKIFTRTRLKGIRIVEEEGEGQSYLERKVSAGSILRVKGTFSAKWRTSAETGLVKKKSKNWTTVEEQYLKCLDKDEKEVMIPFKQKGKFNIIYEKGSKDSRCILHMKDIISNFSLPLKVRLLFGKAPVNPCIFTGMLVLKSHSVCESIVGSTASNRRNVLFELPLDLPCTVEVAENERESCGHQRAYKDGKKLCQLYAVSYSSLIKLSPNMDTDQEMYQHIPTAKAKRGADDTLQTLDLITNISLTDEPVDTFIQEFSDTDSVQSADQSGGAVKGSLMELKEITTDTARDDTLC
ncbi:uncharacterized protein LOC117325232 [Pecten maximus]|uniref:uncharacterized protein LOC117325232 n=1 Tax=Pecten maximus TaxID=6579 RepID=UPI00145903B0|nr:uncharacterized protein LOC117325232 [Pecten maximus]